MVSQCFQPCSVNRVEQDKHEFLYWEFKEKQAVRMGDWKAVRQKGKMAGWNCTI